LNCCAQDVSKRRKSLVGQNAENQLDEAQNKELKALALTHLARDTVAGGLPAAHLAAPGLAAARA
jgi:hypothetical protein